MFKHVREIIAYLIVLMFGYALWRNPSDTLLLGALIGSFSGGAVGYYLGGSKTGSDTARQNADTVTQKAIEPKS